MAVHYRLKLGRFELAFNRETRTAVRRKAQARTYDTLKARALALAPDRSDLEWELEDLWEQEGASMETLSEYLRAYIAEHERPR